MVGARSNRRNVHAVVAVLVGLGVTSFTVGSATAQPIDPPGHGAPARPVAVSATPDPRGPDARDAAQAAVAPATVASRPDPRSPDARDAALTAVAPAPTVAVGEPTRIVVREHPDALPLALAVAALLVALASAYGVAHLARPGRRTVGLGH